MNQKITSLALLVALFITSSFSNAQGILERKWNPQAKGTAIGAAAGGAAGAIIHKRNRVVGAGVGMAAGAAAGYAIGKGVDNRRRRAAVAARAAENREFASRTAREEQRELRSGTSNRSASRRSAVRKAAPVAAAAAVAAGGAYALSQNSLLEQPAPVVTPFTRNGYLLNTSYGEPNTAYPNSEYRRKSW